MTDFHEITTPEKTFDRKTAGRRFLAALPIEEKVKRLVKLQQLTIAVDRAIGRPVKRPWDIKGFSDSET